MKSVIANENISAKSVRLISADNSINEVMATDKAFSYARDLDLDLVQITDGDVPVVKALELNKYLYEQKQAEKTQRKKQRTSAVQTKEIQFNFGTQENDLNVKAKNARSFLDENKMVRVVMKLGGRISNNNTIMEQNKSQLQKFVELLGEVDFVQKIDVQGKYCTCIVKQK